MTPLHSIIPKYPGLRCHFYADDTQIYLSFSLELAFSALFSIESCFKDVFSWMIGNKLSINLDKTRYLLLNYKNINVPVSIILNLNTVSPSESTKHLRIIFQSDMFMDTHISSVIKTYFLQFSDFHHFKVSSLNLLLLHLQMPLYIPALITVIAFYMVFQSICFIACKKYKTLLLLLIYIRTFRSSHITPILKSLH